MPGVKFEIRLNALVVQRSIWLALARPCRARPAFLRFPGPPLGPPSWSVRAAECSSERLHVGQEREEGREKEEEGEGEHASWACLRGLHGPPAASFDLSSSRPRPIAETCRQRHQRHRGRSLRPSVRACVRACRLFRSRRSALAHLRSTPLRPRS